ncbi:MAG: beta-ketoacyl-[acyl-carrier-protein] synthase family protein [Desulfobacterales bacterium]|nr:beta-ketoacyl-[acyl-carrier-protein] synthase family protein [Desulfobacterales bacterium]
MIDIVITGIGVVSPLGVGRESFWDNCSKAKTGIKKITSFDTSSLRSNVAGWVEDFDPSQFMPPGVYRRMSRISRMAVASSVEALKDSGLILDTIDRGRIAVIMGTSYGSSSHVEDFYISLLRDGPRGAQPFLFPETVPNAPASHIAMLHGITGPNSTFCQNEISAENAILYAQNLLSQNQVDVALVGGADELSAIQYCCYDAVGALNKVRVENDEPVNPKPGGGLILGEGAGVLVMERLDFALERDAEIYAILRSGVITGGVTSIGHYEAEGEQMARAMSMAMKEANVDPGEIDQINVSANFSGELDRMEYNQLKRTFTKAINNLAVTPLKYLTGDFGGAGAIRAAAIVLSLHRQLPLPTLSAEILKGELECSLEWDIHLAGKTRVALMTTTTFGGGSASLIFARS